MRGERSHTVWSERSQIVGVYIVTNDSYAAKMSQRQICHVCQL